MGWGLETMRGGHALATGSARRVLVCLAYSGLVLACGSPASSAAKPTSLPTVNRAADAIGDLNCRLPVAGYIDSDKGKPGASSGQAENKGAGGFVNFPSGIYTAMKDSDLSYVASTRSWVPVSPEAIAPGGSSYAVSRTPASSLEPPTSTLFAVDVRTGVERQLFKAPSGFFTGVLAYTSDGIYVEIGSSTGAMTFSLLLVDPSTGAHRPVQGAGAPAGAAYQAWTSIANGSAWGTLITGSVSSTANSLVQLNLATGTRTTWSGGTMRPVTMIGVDAGGHPIVLESSSAQSGARVEMMLAPGRLAPIEVDGGSFLPGRGSAVRDRYGVWFGSGDGGIWLLSNDSHLRKVATVPPQPGGTGQPYDPHGWRSVAGACS